ncbi:GNAT family N-acetyltransferase [bacterium]|nr:GNAT family N-acetyltransferase [bacterium]
MQSFVVTPIYDKHRDWTVMILKEWWSSTRIVSRGKIHYADQLPGFIALRDEFPIGFITFNITDDGCEIVCLNSIRKGIGVGQALIDAVRNEALKDGCRRLWLITTNDNLKAIRFYQKQGFRLFAVHQNAIEESRKLKPEIPLIGSDGIPIRDEIEIEMLI